MKVITFSRFFPANHPRAGINTFFPEQILMSLGISIYDVQALRPYMNDFAMLDDKKKFHTIRAGNRWKEGEWFSPRIWTGKPYASKQLQFGPPIQIKKIWNFECNFWNTSSWAKINNRELTPREFNKLALHDGLSGEDMISWLRCHPKKNDLWFKGQIICWNEEIVYE